MNWSVGQHTDAMPKKIQNRQWPKWRHREAPPETDPNGTGSPTFRSIDL